jgi:hypothetical protein
MKGKKVKEKTSIATAVSFDGLLKSDYKTVMVHTSGSTATVIQLGVSSRDGMNSTLSHASKKMFESSGQKVIEVTMENGNELR